jgi:hypothetical protein
MPPNTLQPTPEELEELRQRRRASQLKGYGEGVEDPAAQALLNVRRNLGEAGRAVVGAKPYDETNPTGSYRAVQALMNAPTPAAIIPEVGQAVGKAATALSGLGALGVVKPKGGNWLAGSVERGLRQMKQPDRMLQNGTEITLEQAMNWPGLAPEAGRNLAINNWIDSKLGKYIRNELGTPEDPVRALAERGVLHFEPRGGGVSARANRQVLGMPIDPTATSPLAQSWENVADATVRGGPYREHLPMSANQAEIDIPETLRQLGGEYAVQNPDALAYELNRGTPVSEGLGFRHLIDELTNATDPNSGLPRSLQLSPEKLQKVTVPQAVELVDKINKWRAEQKVAADLKRSQNAATVEYKAYDTVPGTAEPNERGLRWVELKAPAIDASKLPEGYELRTLKNNQGNEYFSLRDMNDRGLEIGAGMTPEAAVKAAGSRIDASKPLEDALKYEGETMGHCVGGYCPDVVGGRTRIYSLRDAKGEPHVTVEVKPARKPSQSEAGLQARSEGLRGQAFAERVADLMEGKDLPPNIVQIKGKANRAPKDEYLPFVQDFVRSGQWSSVGDLGNTGLIRINPDSDLGVNIRAANVAVPEFVTQRQLSELLDKYGRTTLPSNPPGYKKGGAVKRKASDLPGYGEGSAGALSDVVRGFMGEKPAEPTNPSELFRLAQALGAFPPVAGAVGAVKRPAGAAAALRELLRTEAPAQSAAAREALRRAYRTGHEHSVVGLTEAGIPGEVVTSGNRTRVIPSVADVSRAVSDPQRRAIVDFHTHPSDVSGLRVAPSADDVAFYADYERGAWPRTLKTFIASPPSTGGGRASTAYSFFETDVPRRVYDKDLFEKAELELQNAGRLGRFDRVRRDPAFAAAFESGSVDLQDLLGEAAPLLLLERRAAQGAGRQRLDLGANAVAPNAELRDFYEMIREPAQEFLKKNKLKKGGAVKIETNPTLMADELLFKGHKRR